MAPGLDTTVLPIRDSKSASQHVFAPLVPEEIRQARDLVESLWPHKTELYYKAITLEEAPKAEAVQYIEAEHSGKPLPSINRKALVLYYIHHSSKFHEAIVNLTTRSIERNVLLGKNIHGAGSGEEVIAFEEIALNDASVRAAIAKLHLPKGTTVVCDPWPYGSDGLNDDDRLWHCFMYMRDPSNPDDADSNHYAFPLSIYPVVDSITRKVVRIDYGPTGKDNSVKAPEPWKPTPSNEYMPKYNAPRTDLKPLRVSQPEGVSFEVKEQGSLNHITWQKWNFKLGFNYREGMVLYDVRYDGRPLFYRISLSDMNIPYSDPRHPYHKKSAFDLGDAGAGVTANNLQLGCDCLGSIHYISSTLADEKGNPLDMPNCVCIHEQDNGLLWKHQNYRTGKAAVVRNRELLLQSIITVANYEYILVFILNQAGELAYEVRATGILSTQAIDHGIEVPWGTVVHPGVLACYHQHIFSLRIDPMIDGHQNRLVYEEAIAMPRDGFNKYGNGYITEETLVERSGGYDLNADTNRTFKIQNSAVRNAVNGKAVGYKIVAPTFQKILSHEDSFNFKRAEFADKNIYALRYREDELFAGGKHTNQSRGGTGIRGWAARQEPIVDDDLVVFVQFGINHIPSTENFPVMPVETMKVTLKPVNFFARNPAIDVPNSTQAFNGSTLLSVRHQQPGVVGKVDATGGCCTAANGGTNGNHNGQA